VGRPNPTTSCPFDRLTGTLTRSIIPSVNPTRPSRPLHFTGSPISPNHAAPVLGSAKHRPGGHRRRHTPHPTLPPPPPQASAIHPTSRIRVSASPICWDSTRDLPRVRIRFDGGGDFWLVALYMSGLRRHRGIISQGEVGGGDLSSPPALAGFRPGLREEISHSGLIRCTKISPFLVDLVL
jgi:hypothetical protein